MKKTNYIRIATLIPAVSAGIVNLAAGCSSAGPDEQLSAPEQVGVAESELTAEQCMYFSVNGTVRICHKTNSTTHPYTVLKVSEQACVVAHAAHEDDYVAVNDPTCQGGGCLPPLAPCDATLPCCSGTSCVLGVCVPTCVPTTCAAQGVACGTISDGCGDTLDCGANACSNGGGTCANNACTCPPPENYDSDCVENAWDAAEQECELTFLSKGTGCSIGECDGNGFCGTFPGTEAP